MDRSASALGQAGNAAGPGSRIDTDIQTLKRMIGQLDHISNTIVMHARTLGYSDTPKETIGALSPQPVITTLADAISGLDRAIERTTGSLHLFD
jgi:hypothetical protein